jgi:uncharacterized membrane protein HdeD (DUF308 family)
MAKATTASTKRRKRRHRALPKARGGWFMTLGGIWIFLGLTAMAVPLAAHPPADLFLCAILSAAGAAQVILPLRDGHGRAMFAEFASAAVFIVAAGTLLLLRPRDFVMMSLLIAAFFTAEGLIKFTFAVQVRPSAEQGWALFAAIMTFVLAIMAWLRWPAAALWVLGLLVGLYLAMGGWSFIAFGLAARRAARRRRPA